MHKSAEVINTITNSNELANKIQAVTRELQRLGRDKDTLYDPEVLSKSQELDKLIIAYYKCSL